MQVQQLMTPSPRACAPNANLCEAVQMMWEGDFGALPVVSEEGRVLGILTDRDISIALGTRNRAPSRLRVSEVMAREVWTCRNIDESGIALKAMRDHRVRRLPVVDAEGRLCGIFSLNDAILAGNSVVSSTEIADTLRVLCAPRKPTTAPLVAA